MRVIQRGRRGGKTTKIIAAFIAAGPDARLVVATTPERDRLFRKYKELQDEDVIRRVIVAAPFCLKGHHGEVFLDNADWVLSFMLGEAVDVASVNE